MNFTAAIFDLITLEVVEKMPPKPFLITVTYWSRIKWKFNFNKHLIRNYTRAYANTRRSFWSGIKTNQSYSTVLLEINKKIKQVIPHVNAGGGKLTSNDKEIAQKYYVFASVFTKEITIKNYLTEFEARTHGNNITFTENDGYES